MILATPVTTNQALTEAFLWHKKKGVIKHHPAFSVFVGN